MGDAKNNLANTMATFVSTFAPGKPEETLLDKFLTGLVEDALDFVLGQVLKPVHALTESIVHEGAELINETLDSGIDQLKDLAKEAGELLV
jgi:hypothetical protein